MSANLLNTKQKSVNYESGDVLVWDKSKADWVVEIEGVGDNNNLMAKGVQEVQSNGDRVTLVPTTFSSPYSNSPHWIDAIGAYGCPYDGYYQFVCTGFYPSVDAGLGLNMFIRRESDSLDITQSAIQVSSGNAAGGTVTAMYTKLNKDDVIRFQVEVFGDATTNNFTYTLSVRLISRI